MMLQPLRCCETVHSMLEMQTLIKSGIYKIKPKGMGVKGEKAQARRDVSKLGTSRFGLSSSYLAVSAGLTSIKELKGTAIGEEAPPSALKAVLLWSSEMLPDMCWDLHFHQPQHFLRMWAGQWHCLTEGGLTEAPSAPQTLTELASAILCLLDVFFQL